MDFRKILVLAFLGVGLSLQAQTVGVRESLGDAIRVNATDLNTNLKTGFIPIDIGAGRVLVSNDISSAASSFLGSGSLPIYKRINGATDKVAILSWVASGVEEVAFSNVALPPDYDNTAALEVHLLVYKSANVNTGATIDVQVFSGIGDTEMGSATSAITATTATEYTVSLTGANVGAHPGVISINLVPSAHTSDTVNLLAIWIEYTRRS